jgi:hypothetical protein
MGHTRHATITPRLSAGRTRVIAALAAMMGMLALLAPASTLAKEAHLRNVGSGMCLNSTRESFVYVTACHGADEWSWDVRFYSGHLVDRNTGRCLEAAHVHEGGVYTARCRNHNSNYQAWALDWPLEGPFELLNDGPGQCLTIIAPPSLAEDVYVYMGPCGPGSDTQWRLPGAL